MTSIRCWSRAARARRRLFSPPTVSIACSSTARPILIGGGKPAIGDIGLTDLADAHGRWRVTDSRLLGSDRLDVYERVREG